MRIATLCVLSSVALGLSVAPGCDRPSTAPVAADNTARNTRDADGTTKTPIDQGMNETDRSLTQRIRDRVMGLDDLAVNGQNVKVISNNGRVTLRGPVDSEDERSRIVAAARAVAGEGNVDDQLEVK
jgi:osmotically-inducible protein OsmY